MTNSYDEIKQLLENSRKLLNKNSTNDLLEIRRQYGVITEQNVVQPQDPVGDSIEQSKNNINNNSPQPSETTKQEKGDKDDMQQSYRISGGVISLHGKEKADIEITTDEKVAFQETMDEFLTEVSDLVNFEPLNVYKTDVEWGGKIVNFDVDFYFIVGEDNGIYINGEMLKIDDEFIEMITKLRTFYEKFKSKWAKVVSNRKRTAL